MDPQVADPEVARLHGNYRALLKKLKGGAGFTVDKSEKKALLKLIKQMIRQYEKRRVENVPEQFVSRCGLEVDETGAPLMPCNPLAEGECPDTKYFDPVTGLFKDRPWVNTYSKDPTTGQLVRCVPQRYFGAAEGQQPEGTKTLLYRLFDSVTKMEDEWAKNEQLAKAQLGKDVGYVGADQLIHPVMVAGPKAGETERKIKKAGESVTGVAEFTGDPVNISSCAAAQTAEQCDMKRTSAYGPMGDRCYWTGHAAHLLGTNAATAVLKEGRYEGDNPKTTATETPEMKA